MHYFISKEEHKDMPTTIPISSLLSTNTTIRDLFVYLYELAPLEVDILFVLIKNSSKALTLEDLAKLVDRQKTTVFKSLQKLVALRLCNRTMATRKEGGYYYLFTAISIEELKVETEKRVKELERSMNQLLRAFENHVHKAIITFYEEK
jgi:predicted transcriptional regulator